MIGKLVNIYEWNTSHQNTVRWPRFQETFVFLVPTAVVEENK